MIGWEGVGEVVDWRLTLTRAVLSGTPPSGLFSESLRLLGWRGCERGRQVVGGKCVWLGGQEVVGWRLLGWRALERNS